MSQSVPSNPSDNQKARSWTFTINNPTIDKDQLELKLNEYNSKCYAFQRECGLVDKTIHFQGFFQVPNPIWTNSIKKHIPGIWVEPANNNSACWTYANKDDETYVGDRVSYGPPPRNNKNRGGKSLDLLKYIQNNGFLESVQ
jgi:hypothetical protein